MLRPGTITAALLLAALAPFAASAEGDESAITSSKLESAFPDGHANKIQNADEIDELVTNNQLRAATGSKSRVSISTGFSYSGGSVKSPLAEERPNLAGSSGSADKALLGGSVSGKYNIDVQNSLSAGVGMRWIAPLSAGGPSNFNGSVFDADNPYLAFQHLYRLAGAQAVLKVAYKKFTNSNLLAEGYDGNLLLSQDTIYDIPGTRLSLGASTWVQTQWFNKEGPIGDPGASSYMPDVRVDQSDWSAAVFPTMEYRITDRVNVRTLVGLWFFEHMRSAGSPHTYKQNKMYQEIGVGIAITRDFFLYPNILFLPENVASDRTNVGLAANVNLF